MKKQGFSKSERIKKRNDFEKIYNSGKTIFSSDKKLKATYLFEKTNQRGLVRAAFAVHRRAGKAVWRNRMKRLLREAYRLNKSILLDSVEIKKGELLIVFSPNLFNEKKYKKIFLSNVHDSVVELMFLIKDDLTPNA